MNFAAWIRSIEGRPKPRLYFLHLVAPHSPWRYLPTGQRYPENDTEPGEIDPPGPGKAWSSDSWLVKQVYQRHLLQTALVDRLLGVFLRRLENVELYHRSLVVVVADHGVGFEPGSPKRAIAEENVGHLAPVPFFLKRPFQEQGKISDVPVETSDVVRTMVDVLDLSKVPREMGGRSALKRIPFDRRRGIGGVTFDPRGGEKYRVVTKKYEIFGPSGDSIDLFDVAPRGTRRLLGKSSEHMNVLLPSGASAAVPRLAEYTTADPADNVFPALLEGTLNGVEAKTVLAVTVNGRIAALCRAYIGDDDVRFAAMLPPSSFAKPPNHLGLFAVESVRDRTVIPLSLVRSKRPPRSDSSRRP